MIIKDYPVKNKNRDLEVDIEISNIQWGNDSIGWYEYWGHMEYDHQPDYVESFDIDEIYYKGKIIHSKKLHNLLCGLLEDDESFRERIEEAAKTDSEERKLEAALDRQEARNY